MSAPKTEGIPGNLPLVVVLDLQLGVYWFYPRWAAFPPAFDCALITLNPGTEEKQIIAPFTWPDTGPEVFVGAWFYGALMTQDLSTIFGDFGQWQFGWGPVE